MDSQSLLHLGIDERKRFDILLDALKDSYKETIDASFKITAILIAVLAWFVSEENPLGMLCLFRPIAYLALVFTAAGWFLLAYLFRLLYLRSDNLYRALKNLSCDEQLFNRYRVSRGMVLISLFGQLTLLLGIFSLLFYRYIDADQFAHICLSKVGTK